MSHWKAGKLQLKCSIDVLRRALIRIMPEWEQHLVIDKEGRIPIYTYTGNKLEGQGFHIMIPGVKNPQYAGAPGLKYNDVGLRLEADGTWTAQIDNTGFTKIKNLEPQLQGEVMRMKAIAIAKIRGHRIIKDENNEDESITDMEIDKNTARQFLSH